MSRAEWILGGMLVVLLVVVAALAIMFWFQPEAPVALPQTAQIASTPSYIGQTSLSALIAAQKEAAAWQADAQLLKAAATWPQGADEEFVSDAKTAWSFTFYSPGRQATAVISVVENQASFLREKEVDNPLSPLPVSSWRIDSPAAVRTMLNEGGEAFLQREGVTTMAMNLSTVSENGRVEWFISLFGEQTGHSFSVRLDAATGEILEVFDAT